MKHLSLFALAALADTTAARPPVHSIPDLPAVISCMQLLMQPKNLSCTVMLL